MGQLAPPGVLDRVLQFVDLFDGTTVAGYTPRPGPTDVSGEIGACYLEPSSPLRDLTPAQRQVLAWLRAYRREIEQAEREFRIDRRAIAGAIAWEMLKNVWQQSLRSVGPGKIHLWNYSATGALQGLRHSSSFSFHGLLTAVSCASDTDTLAKQTEDAGYLPVRTFQARAAQIATPEGAIRYIGAIMSAVADISVREGFEDIRGNPVVLTNVYQGKTLTTWQEHLRGKPAGARLEGGNPMDIWVASHLRFLEDGVGQPKIPRVP